MTASSLLQSVQESMTNETLPCPQFSLLVVYHGSFPNDTLEVTAFGDAINPPMNSKLYDIHVPLPCCLGHDQKSFFMQDTCSLPCTSAPATTLWPRALLLLYLLDAIYVGSWCYWKALVPPGHFFWSRSRFWKTRCCPQNSAPSSHIKLGVYFAEANQLAYPNQELSFQNVCSMAKTLDLMSLWSVWIPLKLWAYFCSFSMFAPGFILVQVWRIRLCITSQKKRVRPHAVGGFLFCEVKIGGHACLGKVAEQCALSTGWVLTVGDDANGAVLCWKGLHYSYLRWLVSTIKASTNWIPA